VSKHHSTAETLYEAVACGFWFLDTRDAELEGRFSRKSAQESRDCRGVNKTEYGLTERLGEGFQWVM
jgi:hypothetical protein